MSRFWTISSGRPAEGWARPTPSPYLPPARLVTPKVLRYLLRMYAPTVGQQ